MKHTLPPAQTSGERLHPPYSPHSRSRAPCRFAARTLRQPQSSHSDCLPAQPGIRHQSHDTKRPSFRHLDPCDVLDCVPELRRHGAPSVGSRSSTPPARTGAQAWASVCAWRLARNWGDRHLCGRGRGCQRGRVGVGLASSLCSSTHATNSSSRPITALLSEASPRPDASPESKRVVRAWHSRLCQASMRDLSRSHCSSTTPPMASRLALRTLYAVWGAPVWVSRGRVRASLQPYCCPQSCPVRLPSSGICCM